MDELRIKDGCNCRGCAENQFRMWREYACRMLQKMTYLNRLCWFKSPDGKEYLFNIGLISKKLNDIRKEIYNKQGVFT